MIILPSSDDFLKLGSAEHLVPAITVNSGDDELALISRASGKGILHRGPAVEGCNLLLVELEGGGVAAGDASLGGDGSHDVEPSVSVAFVQ